MRVFINIQNAFIVADPQRPYLVAGPVFLTQQQLKIMHVMIA